jgi:hypothetical protein
MRLRLLSLLVVTGALALGPAAAANADTGDSTSARATGTVSANLLTSRPPMEQLGRYWS